VTQTVTLLCLPCAGASAVMYMRWRRLLPAWLRLVPVELPGRGARLAQAPARDFSALVEQVAREQAGEMQGDYALFGHSMGALLAYGLARRQTERGGPMPLALLASASPAPGRRDPARYADLQGDAALIADLRKQGGTPQELFDSPELLRLTLDVLAADYDVCRSFQDDGARALPVPVHALAGRDDDIEAHRIEGWPALGQPGSTIDWFDGHHFFIRQNEAAVLRCVEDRLAAVRPFRQAALPGCARA
jgi:surfactin synthase thioesterase subunit